MSSNPIARIRLLSVVLVSLTLLLVSRLYFLQVVRGEVLSERADRQYSRPNESIFDRGSIFFENKDGSLLGAASLKAGFTLSINPKLIDNPEEVYIKLSKIVTLDRENFLAKAKKTDDPYEEIAKRVSETDGKKIAESKIVGVSIFKDRWRFYPASTLGAHLIGFVGYKGDTLAGRYGLESYYDDVLRRNSSSLYTNFFAEAFSGVKKVIKNEDRFEGDLLTTIEPTVESFFEKELSVIQQKYDSRETGGVIINPINGEIYAMATVPTFDPNFFQTEKNPRIFGNPIVENVYEMGSIIKPLTLAAGLDAAVVDADSTYNDQGSLSLDGATISNFDHKARGVVSMQEVLNQSLNTGAAYVALKLGNDKLTKYLLDFGLGEETGIDLPNEIPGLIANLKSPRDLEHVTASFGQGIAMTPIITVRALSALGNGGTLPNPHLVKRIDYDIGVSKKISFPEQKRVIKKETSEEITRMLVSVVDTALLGGTVKIKNYSVAAKTGTAQIAKEGGGGYYDDRFLHSFFGYFPAYNPKFLIFLYTIEPKGVGFASHTLTEPFIKTTKFLINYYQVPPDR